MQRWWYLDDKNKIVNNSVDYFTQANTLTNNATDENERQWTFRVLVTQTLNPFEGVAVIGECSALGKWLPQRATFMTHEEGMCGLCFCYFDKFISICDYIFY